jgi:signal transduction histidine kinase
VKIGRELHDDLGQRMSVLSVQLDLLTRDHPELADAATQPQSTARQVATRIHEIACELHPSRLRTLGLVSTLRLLFGDLIGFDISYEVNRMPKRIPDDVSLCVYRVAQEALNNAMRHSGTDRAVVTLHGVPGGVRLVVRDEGCGIQLAQANTDGLGLVSMRERARLIGGTLSIISAREQGTQVTLELPYGQETRPD